jgi:acyl carrier protein
MTNRIISSSVLGTLLLFCVLSIGCGRSQSGQPSQQTVDRVRLEVAKILKKDASQIDITKPLATYGADELDVVEIVMAVEDAFKIEIPDRALDEKPDDIRKTLTVQKLAEIVSGQPKTK